MENLHGGRVSNIGYSPATKSGLATPGWGWHSPSTNRLVTVTWPIAMGVRLMSVTFVLASHVKKLRQLNRN